MTKRLIDYIFYTPYVQGRRKEPDNGGGSRGNGVSSSGGDGSRAAGDGSGADAAGVAAPAPVVAYSRSQMVTSALLRFTVLLLFSVVPAAAIISSGLETTEKAIVIALSLLSLRIFEVAAEGTIFKPQIAGPLASSRYIGMSDEKLAEKKNAQNLIRASVGALSSYFIPKARPTSEEARPVRASSTSSSSPSPARVRGRHRVHLLIAMFPLPHRLLHIYHISYISAFTCP